LTEAELAAWLGRASILALPARYEPFGLLPLEAALSGCALVLGDIPSLHEVWGDAAEYVDPEDPRCLAEALKRTMVPSRLEERAEVARKHARRYSAPLMGDAYRALYADMCSGAERGVACAS
jgi:glycosyltransferase involved in cell wall biosynthesis